MLATLRSRKLADARRALFETAMKLFRERGFDETTVEEIAARAGCSPPGDPPAGATAPCAPCHGPRGREEPGGLADRLHEQPARPGLPGRADPRPAALRGDRGGAPGRGAGSRPRAEGSRHD